MLLLVTNYMKLVFGLSLYLVPEKGLLIQSHVTHHCTKYGGYSSFRWACNFRQWKCTNLLT
jgi:hypothetical protein